MAKNLHTKIILILLVCFTLVLLAFACTPSAITVLPDESGSGSGGGAADSVDVSGGTKTDVDATVDNIKSFFALLKDVTTSDDESDHVAFDLTTRNMTVVESGRTFEMYVDLKCKYNRRDDSESELLMEMRSAATREVVFGVYYYDGIFYMSVANEDGATTLYFDDISLGDIVTVTSGLTSTAFTTLDGAMSMEIPGNIQGISGKKIGDFVNILLKDAFKSVTETTKDDVTQIVVKTDLNRFLSSLMFYLNLAQSFLTDYHVDSMLSSVFGVTITNITNYTFENITADFVLNIKDNKLYNFEVDLGYGVDNFAIDFVMDSNYFGNSVNGVEAIVFPEFTDYRRFSLTNIEFAFEVALENDTPKSITMDNLVGDILKAYFNVDSLGAFGESTVTLGAGSVSLYVDVNAEVSWNRNEKNYIEMNIYEKKDGTDKLIGSVYYLGSRNSLYVDFSYVNLPKFVYEGINVASLIKSFVVETVQSMFGTAESSSSESTEMRALLTEAFGKEGDDYDAAMSRLVRNGVYEVSAAETGDPVASLSTFDIIDQIVATIEKKPEGRRSIAVTADRELLLSVIQNMEDSAEDSYNDAVAEKNKAEEEDGEIAVALAALTAKEAEIEDKEAEIAAIDAQYEAATSSQKQGLDKDRRDLRAALAVLQTERDALREAYDTVVEKYDAVISKTGDKYDLFHSIIIGARRNYSTSDLALRSIRAELGLVEGFGIFADIEAKLSEDTFLNITIDRLSFGYAPTFLVPKDEFVTYGYSSLEEFSTVSLSAMLTLSGDTGSLSEEPLNIGNALGNVIAELDAILGVEDRLSGGLDVTFDANIIFDPIRMSSYFGGDNVGLNLSKVELAIKVYAKPDVSTVSLVDENLLLSVYYGEYATGESAIFVDASALSISEDGTTLPKVMYKIRLEDLFAVSLAERSETVSLPEVSAAESLSGADLLAMIGGFFGGASLDDGVAVVLADRTLATLVELLADMNGGNSAFGRLINGRSTETVIDLDSSSRVFIQDEDGLKIGATVVFDTGRGTLGYVNPSVNIVVSDISASLTRRDIIPEEVTRVNGDYHDISSLEALHVAFELDLDYVFSDMEYSLSDFTRQLALQEWMPS